MTIDEIQEQGQNILKDYLNNNNITLDIELKFYNYTELYHKNDILKYEKSIIFKWDGEELLENNNYELHNGCLYKNKSGNNILVNSILKELIPILNYFFNHKKYIINDKRDITIEDNYKYKLIFLCKDNYIYEGYVMSILK